MNSESRNDTNVVIQINNADVNHYHKTCWRDSWKIRFEHGCCRPLILEAAEQLLLDLFDACVQQEALNDLLRVVFKKYTSTLTILLPIIRIFSILVFSQGIHCSRQCECLHCEQIFFSRNLTRSVKTWNNWFLRKPFMQFMMRRM